MFFSPFLTSLSIFLHPYPTPSFLSLHPPPPPFLSLSLSLSDDQPVAVKNLKLPVTGSKAERFEKVLIAEHVATANAKKDCHNLSQVTLDGAALDK